MGYFSPFRENTPFYFSSTELEKKECGKKKKKIVI